MPSNSGGESALIFILLALSAAVGWAWRQRGRSFIRGVVLSVLCTILFGLVVGILIGRDVPWLNVIAGPALSFMIARMLKPDHAAREERLLNPISGERNKKCPFCAEVIKAEAKVCRFCGREVVDGVTADARPTAEV